MLKRRALVLFLVALMLALPVVAAAAGSVIKDEKLEALVRRDAELADGVDITKKNIKLLTELEIDEPGVAKLDGLEYALELERLIFTESAIKDLGPIQKLESLKYVAIAGNDAVDAGDIGFDNFNPASKQMRILQDIQHNGAVVTHPGPVSRISGPDRYETAVRIFQNYVEDLEPALDTVVLARGDVYADALAGAPLASNLNAPILLTTPDKLHKETKKALVDYIEDQELSTLTVYVLGGQKAVSNVVVNELKVAIAETDADPSLRIKRIEGADRYETAVEIADILGIDDEDEVFFASGENYPDALAAAPYAAYYENPILLTRKNALPECVVEYFKDLEKEKLLATVIGGKAAVSTAVYLELGELEWKKGRNVFDDDAVYRIGGKDRYETAVELAEYFGEAGDNYYYIATGENFADALTGAVLAANTSTGILLVKSNAIPNNVRTFLVDKLDDTSKLTILGGEAAVSRYNAVDLFKLVPTVLP